MGILEEIKEERARQDAKWGERNHPFVPVCIDSHDVQDYIDDADRARKFCDCMFKNGAGSWEEIFKEEYHEAFAEAAQGNMKAFREELIQVAAVVVAMIECVDRNNT